MVDPIESFDQYGLGPAEKTLVHSVYIYTPEN